MAEVPDYRVLLLTSIRESFDEVTAIAGRHFEHVDALFWELGDMSTKNDVLQRIAAAEYNLIVSYVNGVILKRDHLDRAHFGALNIHPAPPEHGGAFGIFCQPVIRRDIRTHHGVTVHEMDEQIDHGPIYRVRRWDVPEDATIASVAERSLAECLDIYEECVEELGRSPSGTACFHPIDEAWDPLNRYHTPGDVRRWFEQLDPAHPAHQERVWLNHPRAIYSPPYFDDV